ncbi:MAG: hypothetical protein MJH11_17390, partial [Lentisphaeria bacterium]|nr:hypothetical protein [Lentisphaeria bacterium]
QDQLFYDVTENSSPVIMLNHFQNVQYTRLFDKKNNYEKVLGPKSFNDIEINWSLLDKNINVFNQRIFMWFIKKGHKKIRRIRKSIRLKKEHKRSELQRRVD